MRFKAVRDSRVTTLTLNEAGLQNLFNFMKRGNVHMEYQEIKAKTNIYGKLQFEVTVPNSLIKQISPEAALDAIVQGLVS